MKLKKHEENFIHIRKGTFVGWLIFIITTSSTVYIFHTIAELGVTTTFLLAMTFSIQFTFNIGASIVIGTYLNE